MLCQSFAFRPHDMHDNSIIFDCSALDEAVTAPGDGSEQEDWVLDDAGNSSTAESQMTDSLVLASTSEVNVAMSRTKRGILFPSGVKLCSQETVKQALQNHLDYFHLRGMEIRSFHN